MTADEFRIGTEKRVGLFDLLSPTQPFMQTASLPVGAKIKSIQKLLPGLPDEESKSPSSNAFFHARREIGALCLPLAAVALFHQANYGIGRGKSKYGTSLRGDDAITVLVHHASLRRCIWRNVIPSSFLLQRGFAIPCDLDNPTWLQPVRALADNARGAVPVPKQDQLLRGLFWQPCDVQLVVEPGPRCCELTGVSAQPVATGLRMFARKHDYEGFWRHPHSPMSLGRKNRPMHLRVPSRARHWSQFAGYFWPSDTEGIEPSWPVLIHDKVWPNDSVRVLLGGYRCKNNEQIDFRLHESWSLPAGWGDQMEAVRDLLAVADESLQAVAQAAGRFAQAFFWKKDGDRNKKLRQQFKERARDNMLARSEPCVQEVLQEISYDQVESARVSLTKQMQGLACAVLKEITLPYCHSPEGLHAHVAAQRVLDESLAESRRRRAA